MFFLYLLLICESFIEWQCYKMKIKILYKLYISEKEIYLILSSFNVQGLFVYDSR